MAFALSARDLRALQRGAAIVVIALAYVLGIRPSRERRAQLLEQLEAERAVLAREHALVNQAPAAATATAPAVQLFDATDPVVASASLAEYIASEAEQHNVWVQQSVTMAPSAKAPGANALEVTVRAESDLTGLLRLLRALEQGRVLAQVTALDVRAAGESEEMGMVPLSISATVRSMAAPAGASR